MQSAEIELKFPVDEVERFRARVFGLGFRLLTPRTLEQNTLYDTPNRTLRERTELLRIRRYGSEWTLTHKRAPEGEVADVRYKTRIETETTLDDGETLAQVFTHLGFGPVFRYEKYRTEWESDGGHLVLDETPIGVWAELEGRPEWIDNTLSKLGVDQSRTLTLSYGALFLDWKEKTGSPAENLTFEDVRALVAG